ncbi:MAG TPA: alpha/beta fold hydrolase [Thermoanaerobaculia bacterium]|nr:alpha/beta fold hydrolase [Thermoanaerobaculia bacterium]
MRARTWLTFVAATVAAATAVAQPTGSGARQAAQALMTAHPEARWLADGRLAHRSSVDGTYRALDPRNGGERPLERLPPVVERRVVRRGLFAHLPPVLEVPSPDGAWLAGTAAGDLWVRSADDRRRLRLTGDGSPERSYDVAGALWSPDGRRVAVRRIDGRGVPTVPIVRWSEPGQPVERLAYSRVGEPVPRVDLVVVDARGGGVVEVDVGDGGEPYLHAAGWSPDGERLYVLRMTRLMDRLDLLAVDAATGQAHTVLSETSSTFIGGLPFLHGYEDALARLRLVVPLGDGERLVWTSERDGWRRLYLYDLAGRLLAPLTPEGSEIVRLEAVDEEGGWLYYTARPDPRRPYDQALLRVRLDGGSPQRLVDGPFFDEVSFAPGGGSFWVLRSGRRELPVAELRRASGELVRAFWSPDPRLVERARLPAPEEFVVAAADGETPLHGLLYTPRDFDPRRRYPVIDHLYAGPHTIHVPRTMRERLFWAAQDLADQGYVVVLVDARGTPGRGKAFQDATHGRIGEIEIADHAAAIRGLAAERPFMDLDRVGVVGHSWGGYFAIRALLLEPSLFRAAVATAPAVDLDRFRVAIEPYMGCLPAACPEAYARGSNTALAERLEGALLLLHGTADDDVPLGETMAMIAALVRAGKPYDLALFPGAHHVPQMEHGPFWRRMTWRHLAAHLRPEVAVRSQRR